MPSPNNPKPWAKGETKLDPKNLSSFKKKQPKLDEKYLKKKSDEDLSDPIGKRLHAALRAGTLAEERYRRENIRHWVVEFVDVSEPAKALWGKPGLDPVMILREFQNVLRPVLQRHHATYISNAEGSQVVACFEKPQDAAEAAIEAQHVLIAWDNAQSTPKSLIPSIGMHLGDVVYTRGELKQSNTCNLAKRVQTEAKAGEIYMSKPMYEELGSIEKYPIKYTRTAMVKNIPVPQELYQLHWADMDIQTEEQRLRLAEIEGYREHLAIFYIDVCESSKKFWNLGDRMGNELITDYQNIVEPVLKKNGACYQESSEGDQVMACFPGRQPHRAIDAAIEIQGLLFRRNTYMNEKKQVRAAIGLHIGDVLRHKREIIETVDLKIGKGIQGEAGADEIFVSEALYNLFVEEGRYDIRYVDAVHLKGVTEEQNIYKVVWHRSESRKLGGGTLTDDRKKLEASLAKLTRKRPG